MKIYFVYIAKLFNIYKKCINFTHLYFVTLCYSSFHFGESRIQSKSKVSLSSYVKWQLKLAEVNTSTILCFCFNESSQKIYNIYLP
jgi:hypothetical protein